MRPPALHRRERGHRDLSTYLVAGSSRWDMYLVATRADSHLKNKTLHHHPLRHPRCPSPPSRASCPSRHVGDIVDPTLFTLQRWTLSPWPRAGPEIEMRGCQVEPQLGPRSLRRSSSASSASALDAVSMAQTDIPTALPIQLSPRALQPRRTTPRPARCEPKHGKSSIERPVSLSFSSPFHSRP